MASSFGLVGHWTAQPSKEDAVFSMRDFSDRQVKPAQVTPRIESNDKKSSLVLRLEEAGNDRYPSRGLLGARLRGLAL